MNAVYFMNFLKKLGIEFFVGVPDSQLKPFIDLLVTTHGYHSQQHVVVANEGNAVAVAAGYYLATGNAACVYLQNSGLGNIFNPVTSLLSEKVYQIPCVFVIGWRGKPGVPDEPQHIHQGEITLDTLDLLGIPHMVINEDVSGEELEAQTERFLAAFSSGQSIAFIIDKGGLSSEVPSNYGNEYSARREDIIESIVRHAQDDIIVATTGKTSRELFEVRERKNQPHDSDFLTVGSMGHSSSIALGTALVKKERRVWCIDGDGSALMHMGSMAVIGALAPSNYVHILVNNESHESVGGQPTVSSRIDFCAIAQGCNYRSVEKAYTLEEFENILTELDKLPGPVFIEVKAAIGSRPNLGRPTISPVQNKEAFMRRLRSGRECEH